MLLQRVFAWQETENLISSVTCSDLSARLLKVHRLRNSSVGQE